MRRRFLHSAPERDLPAQHTYFEISDLRRFFDAGVIFATVWVRFIGKTSGGRYNEIRHQRNQGLMMDRIRNNETVEQRRRVLKGALGASTVLTLGYGGSAAAASIGCVKNTYIEEPPPANGNQFSWTDPAAMTGVDEWAWSKVDVWECSGNVGGIPDTDFEGFSLDSGINWYRVPAVVGEAPTLIALATKKSSQSPAYPKTAWVLAYFDANGNFVGNYPAITMRTEQNTPLEGSCLASVNPNAKSGFTYGG